MDGIKLTKVYELGNPYLIPMPEPAGCRNALSVKKKGSLNSMRLRTATMLMFVTTLALVAGACADDGAEVRVVSDEGSGSVSGTGSGSLSGTATGLSLEEFEGGTDNPLVQQAVDNYKAYVAEQIDLMIAGNEVLADAIRAGDLDGSRSAYAPARVEWERIEPIAGLIEEIDGAVDSRVDDFEGPDDPEFTGWHRIEYILWELETTDGATPFADRLQDDLAILRREMSGLELPPAAVAIGAAELIEEVSEGKITGEEDRYSKTDLWDFNANVEGARQVIEFLRPALEQADPDLLDSIDAGFSELNATLSTLRDGTGWVLYCRENDSYPSPLCTEVTVTQDTIDLLKAQLAGLSENISLTAGTLGLK